MPLRVDKSVTFTNRNNTYSMTDKRLVDQICSLVNSMDNLSMNDRLGQLKAGDHLDLATRNSPGGYWDRRTLAHVGRNLPHECREYLLEVKTVDRDSMLYKLFTESVFKYSWQLNPEDLYYFFDIVEESLVKKMNPRSAFSKEERIKEIRHYLRLYRRIFLCLHVRKFQLIMGYCTNPKLNLDNSELTIEVLETFYTLTITRRNVFDNLPQGNALEVVLRHANERKFDFWGIRRGRGSVARIFNPTVESFYTMKLLKKKHQQVFLFLKYGFRYLCRYHVMESRCVDFQTRSYGGRLLMVNDGVYLMMQDPQRFRMMLIIETMITFAAIGSERDDRMRALGYLFRSIPEPYVTPEEMREKLEYAVCDLFKPKLYQICKDYRDYRSFRTRYFDQDDATYQPRTLEHLCRCKIRRVLGANLNLPDGIKELKVPHLERYLKLYL